MKLVIDMPWERSLSVNHMRFGRGGHYRKKPEVQAWMERLLLETHCRSTFPDQQLFDHYNILVRVDFRFPDKRRRDTHNYFKVICDSVAKGLGIDDKDIRISTGTVDVDRDRPGFTITVEDSDDSS